MRVRLTTESFRHKVDGVMRYHRAPEIIDVDGTVAERLISIGSAVDPDAAPDPKPTPTPPPADTTPETPAADAPERPKNAANKDIWAAYYRAVKGTDPGKMTRDEIIAEVG